jgi:hypothetical protein
MNAMRATGGLCVATVAVTFGMLRVAAQLPPDLPPVETAPGEICGTGPDRLRQLGLIACCLSARWSTGRSRPGASRIPMAPA